PTGTVALSSVGPESPVMRGILGAWSLPAEQLRPLDDATRRAGLAARHKLFFEAFRKFMPITRSSEARMIAAVRREAGRQHVGHVEVMMAFGTSPAGLNGAPGMADWTGP